MWVGSGVLLLFCWGLAPGLWGRASDEERLKKGEVIISFKEAPKSRVHDVQGEILYDASPQLVWEVLTDYEHWAEIFPEITEVKVLERKGNVVKLYLRINNLWPYPDFKYNIVVTENRPDWSLTWTKEGKGSFAVLYGSARIKYFREDPSKTHLTYLVHRDQGWFVPGFSADLDNRSLVISRLMAIKKEVRKRKRQQEGDENHPEIKPKWWKSPFWEDSGESKKKEKPDSSSKGKKKAQP